MVPFSYPIDEKNSIPAVGFGVYLIDPGRSAYDSVRAALETGYRLIDTAAFYRNEADVGRAIRDSGIPREQIFLTTKIWCTNENSAKREDPTGREDAIRQVQESMAKLDVGYVDLILLHSPHHPELREGRWKGLEECVKRKWVRYIGVSNYGRRHIEELLGYASIRPLVNQLEVHVFLARFELVRFCQEHGILVQAYSPLAKARLLQPGKCPPVLETLAATKRRTVAQVMLRYLLQRNLIVLPKSENPGRMRENFAVFDFALTEEEMRALDALDRNMTTGWDPTTTS